jgi:hypothetical protein
MAVPMTAVALMTDGQLVSLAIGSIVALASMAIGLVLFLKNDAPA